MEDDDEQYRDRPSSLNRRLEVVLSGIVDLIPPPAVAADN